MARTTVAASADVTIVSAFQFGGQSGKKRKMVLITLVDPAATSGGWTNGGTDGDILASVLGFTNIDCVLSARAYTTSTKATTAILTGVPSLTGATQGVVFTTSSATTGALTDYTLATTDTLELVLVGY
jgi:hypothetical protein